MHTFSQSTAEWVSRKEIRFEGSEKDPRVFISRDLNGTTTDEQYYGRAAYEVLKEFGKYDVNAEEPKQVLEVEMLDGTKFVTIKSIGQGRVIEEVYKGKQAELKLEEINNAKPTRNVKVQKID